MSVTPRGMSVQEAYREYADGNFRVNRQYQRKLVWTVEEKCKLIDSILEGYPIPLILLATRTDEAGKRTFEILDGMQRLNAVFSYIENRYALSNRFFDIDQLARAKQKSEDGDFVAEREQNRLLDEKSCARLLEYTFAVTEFPGSDVQAINEVFGRINSYGRQLSSQEKRQAGVISPFANCIRELASEIRGDASSNYLDLSEMPQVSVDVSGDDPDYGVRADSTFWCKQGILRRSQLREAEDEQFLADLAISILEGEAVGFSGSSLDEYYDTDTEAARDISAKLNAYGVDALKNAIVSTISVIRKTVEEVDPGSNALKRIVHPEAGSNPIKTGFYAVFMAFYDLCINQGKSPFDSASILGRLNGLQEKLNVAAGQIRAQPRAENIALTKGLIQDFFEDRDPPVSQQGAGLLIRFENALRRSKVETAAFECKQGILNLDDQRATNPDLLERIVETTCGIANIGPASGGAIFVGVADSKIDADRIAKLDGINPLLVGSRYVVGIDRELENAGMSLEAYKKRFVDYIAASSLNRLRKNCSLDAVNPESSPRWR